MSDDMKTYDVEYNSKIYYCKKASAINTTEKKVNSGVYDNMTDKTGFFFVGDIK